MLLRYGAKIQVSLSVLLRCAPPKTTTRPLPDRESSWDWQPNLPHRGCAPDEAAWTISRLWRRGLGGHRHRRSRIHQLKEGVIKNSNNLACLENFPLRDEIEHRLNARVILENDANAAALGEKWMGAGRDVDDLVMLTLGTASAAALYPPAKSYTVISAWPARSATSP